MLYVVGRKSFEVRREKKILLCRVPKITHGKLLTLPCAKKKAHGKVFAVRQHTAKHEFCRVYFFTVRFR